MSRIAGTCADRPLQVGDVVRVIGQDLLWTLIRWRPSRMVRFRLFSDPLWVAWNDIHGHRSFPPEVLERVR